MVYSVLAIVVTIGLLYYSQVRGRLFVRSHLYLSLLESDSTPEAANRDASAMGFIFAAERMRYAQEYSRKHFGGKKLPLIAEARSKGFLE